MARATKGRRSRVGMMQETSGQPAPRPPPSGLAMLDAGAGALGERDAPADAAHGGLEFHGVHRDHLGERGVIHPALLPLLGAVDLLAPALVCLAVAELRRVGPQFVDDRVLDL